MSVTTGADSARTRRRTSTTESSPTRRSSTSRERRESSSSTSSTSTRRTSSNGNGSATPSSERSGSSATRRRTSTSPTDEEARVDLSPEARRITSADAAERTATVRSGDENREPATTPTPPEPTPEELRRQEERDHISNLDRNFEIFDNPGGGDTDGTVSRGDIERVAEGDYDVERAEERLREAGVPDDEIEDHLAGIEETAEYLLDNDSVRDRLDVANDDDGEGDTDGKIARGDLDRVMIEVEAENREARVREAERAAQQPPSEEHIQEAQGAITRWSEPGALEQELGERPLSDLSPAELDALAAVDAENPEVARQIEQAVLRSVEDAEMLEDLPQGDAYSYLLDRHVTGREITGTEEQQARDPVAIAQRQLDGLVREEIEASLDQRLSDRRGDDELDLALERVSGDLEDLAISNPALAGSIQRQAEATFTDYADEFTEVARRDDNWLQRANHAVTGAVRDGVGFLADGFRFAVDVTARVASAPTRLAGRVANVALDVAGTVAGAGLDAVGADGVADNVRNASDRAGDLLQDGADFVADQNENFTRGLGESVAGGVEGLAYAVTDPVGTVEGIAQVVQDPSLLIDSYAQTAEELGVAGAAGQLTGDVLLSVFTGGSGAAARGASVAGRIASVGSRGGRVGSIAARGAARAQTFLDDVARAGGTGRYAAQAIRGIDDVPSVGSGGIREIADRRFADNLSRGIDQLDQRFDLSPRTREVLGSVDDFAQRTSLRVGRAFEAAGRNLSPSSARGRLRGLQEGRDTFDVSYRNASRDGWSGINEIRDLDLSEPAGIVRREELITNLTGEALDRFGPAEANRISQQLRAGNFDAAGDLYDRGLILQTAREGLDSGLAGRLDDLADQPPLRGFDGQPLDSLPDDISLDELTRRQDLPADHPDFIDPDTGYVLAEGRVASLEWLLENSDSIPLRDLRGNVETIFTNSNPRAVTSIVLPPRNSNIARVYSSNWRSDGVITSNSGPAGSFFQDTTSLPEYGPRGHQEAFALPAGARADRAVGVALDGSPSERVVLASQTAPQLGTDFGSTRFGNHAIGGDWQFQFIDNNAIYRRLKDAFDGDGQFIPGAAGVNVLDDLIPAYGPVSRQTQIFRDIRGNAITLGVATDVTQEATDGEEWIFEEVIVQ